MASQPPKVVIVCDFLTTMGGAENVVLAMHEAFPNAPIYTALYDQGKMPAFRELDVRPSNLQKMPAILRRYHKLWPTFASRAMRKLDLSPYDIILTSSYIHSNQIRKARPDQVIISYCHTPPRYYWSHYGEYRRDPGYGKLNPLIRTLMPLMIPHQRKLDYAAAQKVDVFIANSTTTQARIKQYYGRPSTVLHPPVDTKSFSPERERSDYYVTVGRQLPYKRYDLAVAAATKLGKKLLVFGNGPTHQKLIDIAGETIEFRTDRYGNASDIELRKALESARGFIYPAEEDFGIVMVEALAAGAPIVAYGVGGARDIVTSDDIGVLFAEQTVESTTEAIKQAEKQRFFPSKLQRTAKRFDKLLFISKLRKIVNDNAPV